MMRCLVRQLRYDETLGHRFGYGANRRAAIRVHIALIVARQGKGAARARAAAGSLGVTTAPSSRRAYRTPTAKPTEIRADRHRTSRLRPDSEQEPLARERSRLDGMCPRQKAEALGLEAPLQQFAGDVQHRQLGPPWSTCSTALNACPSVGWRPMSAKLRTRTNSSELRSAIRGEAASAPLRPRCGRGSGRSLRVAGPATERPTFLSVL